MEKSKV